MPSTQTRGQIIKGLRESKGMTQGRLARALDIENQSTISMWENDRGNISAENLLKLVEFFGVEPGLLGYELPRSGIDPRLPSTAPDWFVSHSETVHAYLESLEHHLGVANQRLTALERAVREDLDATHGLENQLEACIRKIGRDE